MDGWCSSSSAGQWQGLSGHGGGQKWARGGEKRVLQAPSRWGLGLSLGEGDKGTLSSEENPTAAVTPVGCSISHFGTTAPPGAGQPMAGLGSSGLGYNSLVEQLQEGGWCSNSCSKRLVLASLCQRNRKVYRRLRVGKYMTHVLTWFYICLRHYRL